MAKNKSFLPTRPEEREPTKYKWHNPDFAEAYPALYELLSLGLVDGEARKTATISIFVLDEQLKATIVDRDTIQALWIELDGSKPLEPQLEAAAANPAARWKSNTARSSNPPY